MNKFTIPLLLLETSLFASQMYTKESWSIVFENYPNTKKGISFSSAQKTLTCHWVHVNYSLFMYLNLYM